MAAVSFAPTRRRSLTASAAAGSFNLLLLFLIVLVAAMVSLAMPATALAQQAARTGGPTPEPSSGRAAESNPIRPFHINVPQEALTDLHRRILATRWPDKETVADQSQGAPLAQLQELVRYWGTDYDWRKAEAKLNALPQFTTNIDGIDIHFIHVRSRHKNTLPVIISHGWRPNSEQRLSRCDNRLGAQTKKFQTI